MYFFTYELKKRPYIIIKWAESFDGYFSPTKENRTENRPYWISSLKSRKLAHLWRSHEESILIGVQTANDDNPKLTNRYYKGNNPIRIILDPNNRINKNMINCKANVRKVQNCSKMLLMMLQRCKNN